MTIRGKKRGKARSSRFTCRDTSISNGITATWMTGESWGEPLRNKQLRRTTNISRRIKEHKDKRHFINENPEKDERWRRLRDQYLKRTAVQRQGKGTL